MEDGRNRVAELIQAAVFSGAYSGLVRQYPSAQGLETLRLKWRGRVTALANEIADAGQGQLGSASAYVSPPRA